MWQLERFERTVRAGFAQSYSAIVPRGKPLDSQSKLTKTKNWEDRAGSLLSVRSIQKRWNEELGR